MRAKAVYVPQKTNRDAWGSARRMVSSRRQVELRGVVTLQRARRGCHALAALNLPAGSARFAKGRVHAGARARALPPRTRSGHPRVGRRCRSRSSACSVGTALRSRPCVPVSSLHKVQASANSSGGARAGHQAAVRRTSRDNCLTERIAACADAGSLPRRCAPSPRSPAFNRDGGSANQGLARHVVPRM